MGMDYIRKTYGVPAKRGMRVIAYGKPGVITSAHGPHLMIRLDDYKHPRPYHPSDVKYPFVDYAAFVCDSIWHTCEESGVCPVCDREAKS